MGQVINEVTALDFGSSKEPFFEFGSALNISQIAGGIAINIVPDRCEAKLDIRLLPSQTKEGVLEKIKSRLDELKIVYELEVLQYEQAYLTDPQNFFIKTLQSTASEILGREIPLVASGQGSAGNVISPLGIPIVNAFGVESANVHAPNEWINIDSLPTIYEIYKKTIMDFVKK